MLIRPYQTEDCAAMAGAVEKRWYRGDSPFFYRRIGEGVFCFIGNCDL